MNKEYPSRLIREDRIIGMTFEELEDWLEVRGYYPRVLEENLVIAADIQPKRVNVKMENGVVTKLLYIS